MKPQTTWVRRLARSDGREDPLARVEADRARSTTSTLVRTAAARVATGQRDQAAQGTEAGDIGDVVHLLADAVLGLTEGASEPIDPRLRSPVARGLLQLLRAEVLRIWSEDFAATAPSEAAAAFKALLQLEQALEPSWGLRSSAPSFGPEATELVVEVAHDLRSPVTSVLFLAETLRSGRSGEVNQLQRRQLGLVYSAALALSTVASDLIELAQGGDRLVDRKPVPFSVTETLGAVRDIVRPIAEEKELAVNLFPSTTDYRLGYPMALSRVLLNLTSNALKFTEEGKVDIVAQSKGRTRVEFSVRDTGPGVNPQAVETLYEPFRRTAGRQGYHFSGTGLGLVICRRLVKAMDSELKVETRANWGTRFYFEVDLPPATGSV